MINTDYMYPSMRTVVQARASYEHTLSEPLQFEERMDCIVYPAFVFIGENDEPWAMGGVENVDNQLVDIASKNYCSSVECPIDTIDEVDDDVIYLGHLHPCYGHSITDGLRYVWFFLTAEYKANYRNRKIVYVSQEPIKKWQKELYGLLGIDLDACTCIERPTRFRSVIVPQDALPYRTKDEPRLFSKEYKAVIDTIIANALQRTAQRDNYPSKIYFTRAGWGRKMNDMGEELVVKCLEKQGYAILSPQDYTIAEQIAYLQYCDEFCTTDGSIAHNSLWQKDGAKAIWLRKGMINNDYSELVAHVKQLDVTVIDAHLSLINRKGMLAYYGPFFMYPNAYFCAYFGIERLLFPFRAFKKYTQSIWRYDSIAERYKFEDDYCAAIEGEVKYVGWRLEKILNKYLRICPKFIYPRVFRYLYKHVMNYLLS